MADNGIQNLCRSDILTIQFKKESYYEGQTVEGTIILEPKSNIVLNDILIKFKQSEYFVYVVDEKNTVSDINSQTFFEKRINAGEYLNMINSFSVDLWTLSSCFRTKFKSISIHFILSFR